MGGKKPEARPDPNAGGNGRKNLVRSVENSLRNLQTDYIDLYWVHFWDFSTPVDELMRGLDDLVRQGKVVHIAISDTPAWKVAQLNQYAVDHALSRFIACQAEYSLVQRDAERDLLPMCNELGLSLMPWSPLAGGVLTGKYTREDLEEQESDGEGKTEGEEGSRGAKLTERKISIAEAVGEVAEETGHSQPQVSLAWLLRRRGVGSIILGARTLEQLTDNLGCLEVELSEEQLETLDEASEVDLGFPHDFLTKDSMQAVATGGAEIAIRRPYVS